LKNFLEQKYQFLVDNIVDTIIELDPKGNFIYISPQCFDLFGFYQNELMGTNLFEFIHPEDLSSVKESILDTVKTQKPISSVFRMKHKNGNYICISAKGSVVNANGKQRILVVGRDITEQKQKENKLKQSEELFNKITDQTFMGFAIFQDFDIKYFNPAFSEAIGYSQEDILSWKAREFFNIIYSDDKNKLISLAQKLYSGDNEALNFLQFRINKKSGQVIWVETQTKIVIYEGKKADMIFIQNITPKMEAEQKIKESEEKYRVLFESSPHAVGLINAKGVVVQVNSNVEKIFGYKKEEILGKAFRKFRLFSEEHSKNILESFNKLIKGEIPEPQELQLHRKDGNVIWVSMQASIVKLQNELLFQVITQDISEQKKAEEKLKESEEKYRLITENINDMIIVLNKNFKIEYINEQVHEKLTGYTKTDLIGKSSLKYLHPEDLERVLKEYQDRLEAREGSTELRFKIKSGKYLWFEVKGRAFVNNDGEKKSILISRDITKRKKAEHELKESEEKYRLITEHANDLIDVLNEKFQYEYINEEVHKKVLGYSKEDMIGKFAGNFVHPDDMKDIVEKLREGFAKGVEKTECRIRKKDGTYIWYESKGNVFRDKYGNKKALILSRDITERKLAEIKLKESEENYRLLFENSIEGIWVVDSNTKTSFINPSMTEMLGYDVREVLGKNVLDFVPENEKNKILHSIEKRKKGIKEVIERTFIHKNGKEVNTRLRASPLFDPNGNFKGAMAFIEDITDRKKAEQKLKESEEKYRLISEDADDLISLYDENFNLEYINEQTHSRILGYSVESLNDLAFKMSITHRDDVKTITTSSMDCFKKGKVIYQMRLKHKNGQYLWFETKGKAFLGQNDKKKILYVSRDITERKNSEEELKAKELKYRTLIENLPQRVFLKDKNFMYISCNNKYAEDLNIKADNILGKTDYNFYPKELADKYRTDDIRILSTGEAEEIDEIDILKGQETYVRTIKTPIRDKNGNITGLLGIFWDITERKKVEKQLKESD